MTRRSLHLTVLGALAALALASRVAAATGVPAEGITADRLDGALERQGFEVLDRREMTNRGPFTASLLVRPGCDGWLVILPLQRNAEAESLLERFVQHAELRFWLDGEAHESFPDVAFWIDQKLWRLARNLGAGSPVLPHVFATAEEGECRLAESIAWSAVEGTP